MESTAETTAKATESAPVKEQPKEIDPQRRRSIILGAAFIMATSAVGPGFLTQTATFTARHMGSLAIIIAIVILLDLISQLNIWSIIGVSGMRGPEIANKVFPGLGHLLTIMVCIGGLAFNIGNVGGTALGLNALFGLPMLTGYIIAGLLGITVFLAKDAGRVLDKVTKILGVTIILAILTIVFWSKPPVGNVVQNLFKVDNPWILFLPLITLLGGSCGGYISMAGPHRLLDAGIKGEPAVSAFRRSICTGIAVSGSTRILLFLAILGICTLGGPESNKAILGATNPVAEAFGQAAGQWGYRLFGIALFSAGLTSIVGAAFTSVSTLKTIHPFFAENAKWFICAFIAVSTSIMVIMGGAVKMLIFAGALNGLILPLTLICILLACRNKKIVGENYRHPTLLILGAIVVILLAGYLGIVSLPNIMKIFA